MQHKKLAQQLDVIGLLADVLPDEYRIRVYRRGCSPWHDRVGAGASHGASHARELPVLLSSQVARQRARG